MFVAVLAALVYGLASALIPVLNAEAYIAATAALATGPTAVGVVAAMTLGTVCGKLVIFHGARVGKAYAQRKAVMPTDDQPVGRFRQAIRRANDRMLGWLSYPWRGALTVFVSSLVGMPPLFAVAALAGLSRQSPVSFALAVGLGRAIRFALIALAVTGIL